jgi:Zn-dependent protease
MTGHPFGIHLRIGIGWLVSYLLIAASLVLWFAVPDTPRLHPAAQFLAIAAVPVLLLPMVIAHELAHALVARRLGVDVHEVDLRLVGAPTQAATAARDPGTEALVAIAGPVVSALLGMIALVVAIVLGQVDSEAAALAAWVATCVAAGDLLLAAVSLYPGAPMDGGQLVHAIMRRTSSDPGTVARRTGAVGVAAGWLVMVTGLVVTLTIDPTAGLWLTLVGWFLGRASRLARSQDQLMRLTMGLDVGDAIQHDAPVIAPTLTLDTLYDQHSMAGGPGVYPVQRGTELLGVIDIRDLRRMPARRRMEMRVHDVMRPLASFRSLSQDQDLWDAVALLEQGRMGAVLVVDRADPPVLLGLVTRASVSRLLRSRAQTAGGHGP